jgi:predicted amidohydrolase
MQEHPSGLRGRRSSWRRWSLTGPHRPTPCAATGATALVGAPVHIDGGRRIAVLAVTAAVAYCKVHLGGDEIRYLAPGRGPALLDVRGWQVGLGVRKDTRIDEHLTPTRAQGIDLYAAGLVHTAAEHDELPRRAARIARQGRVPVAFASAAGPTHPRTAGRSGIWDSTGTLLTDSGTEAGSLASTNLRQQLPDGSSSWGAFRASAVI